MLCNITFWFKIDCCWKRMTSVPISYHNWKKKFQYLTITCVLTCYEIKMLIRQWGSRIGQWSNLVRYKYIHNWPLQPFSQDYWDTYYNTTITEANNIFKKLRNIAFMLILFCFIINISLANILIKIRCYCFYGLKFSNKC